MESRAGQAVRLGAGNGGHTSGWRAYEIRELLLDQGSEVDEEQAAALKQFIEDIGGLENAMAAVDMLDGLEKAA